MKITYFMVLAYIFCCVRVATQPCKYFQLNARFFDRTRGIFSKLQLDELIPRAWRLQQFYDDGVRMPTRFPVFVKPEWSQNAVGVMRADDAKQLREIRARIHGTGKLDKIGARFLIQAAAHEKNEYEIFSISHHRDARRYAVLTVTEARNRREAFPINSIANANTIYVEITERFSTAQREKIWEVVRRLGDFKISRVSIRADSPDDLVRGKLHVIEINLFAPMPLNFLDARYSAHDVVRRAGFYMLCLARVTKFRDKGLPSKAVFCRSLWYQIRTRRSQKRLGLSAIET